MSETPESPLPQPNPQPNPQPDPQFGPPVTPQPNPQQWAPPVPISPSESRTWAMLGHLGGIFFGFLAPLVVWAIYRERDSFIKDQSTEALNFQLTLLIGYLVSFVLIFVVIGIFTMIAISVASIIFSILAAVEANQGRAYRYPLTLRMVT